MALGNRRQRNIIECDIEGLTDLFNVGERDPCPAVAAQIAELSIQ